MYQHGQVSALIFAIYIIIAWPEVVLEWVKDWDIACLWTSVAAAPKLRNDYAVYDIRITSNITSFKQKLKTVLFNQAYIKRKLLFLFYIFIFISITWLPVVQILVFILLYVHN